MALCCAAFPGVFLGGLCTTEGPCGLDQMDQMAFEREKVFLGNQETGLKLL